jgi:hypothetical protein
MMIVIIGIGQHQRGDDGAGQAAVNAWKKAFPQTDASKYIRVEREELPGIGLISLFRRRTSCNYRRCSQIATAHLEKFTKCQLINWKALKLAQVVFMVLDSQKP